VRKGSVGYTADAQLLGRSRHAEPRSGRSAQRPPTRPSALAVTLWRILPAPL
jgi:hypothetical protein